MCFDFYSSKLVTFEVLIQCRTQVHLQRKKSKAFTCVLFKGLKGKREVVSLSAVGDFPRITCTTHPLCALQDPPGQLLPPQAGKVAFPCPSGMHRESQ